MYKKIGLKMRLTKFCQMTDSIAFSYFCKVFYNEKPNSKYSPS